MKVSIAFCIVFLGIQFCICDDAPSPAEPLDQLKEDVKKALMNFSLKLNKYLHEQTPEKNVIIAPVSIYSALSLAFLGSDGETKNEFLSALGFSSHANELEKLHSTLGSLLKMAQNSTTANLTIAASIFLQSSLSLQDTYKQDVQKYYESDVIPVDFSAGNDGATNAINAWVNEKTHGKIPKLYEDTIESQTVAILASALYFEAEWMHHFSPALTQPGRFHAAGGKDVDVQYMSKTCITRHYRSSRLKYSTILLEYAENNTVMLIIKPSGNQTITALIRQLTRKELAKILLKSSEKHVYFELPKFNLKYDASLSKAMKFLNIKSAFQQGKANFTIIADSLFVKDIKHSTKLEITEFGTVGGAATGIEMQARSLPKRVKINGPFMFLIYHMKTEAVIFTGIINDPTQT